MNSKADSPTPNDGKGDFEQSLAALEETVRVLEEGELPLEEALKRFEAGTKLLRRCEKSLKQAEQRVDILLKEGNDARPEPFDRDN